MSNHVIFTTFNLHYIGTIISPRASMSLTTKKRADAERVLAILRSSYLTHGATFLPMRLRSINEITFSCTSNKPVLCYFRYVVITTPALISF